MRNMNAWTIWGIGLLATFAAAGCGTEAPPPLSEASAAVTAGSGTNTSCGAALCTWSSPWGAVSAYSNSTCSGNTYDCNPACGLNSCGCVGTYKYNYQCV